MEIYGFDESKNKVEVPSKTKTGDLTQLETTNKNDIVSAINEVFQFANDGKSTLADAIGNGATASMTWKALAAKCYKISHESKETTNNSHCYFEIKHTHAVMIIVTGVTYADKTMAFIRSELFSNGYFFAHGTEDGIETSVDFNFGNKMIDAYIEDGSFRKQAKYDCIQIGYE